ncbi:hypothetical protein [Cytobacillus oceanisediminis]|uniref:hypothetical protein n=1 Tax=Cytobacillus oceanisediminis TaxID=665099 RepID=UPI001FB47EA2|nr:hypothetical protein [Cytobacillus oceanisediminis]UOE58098.1 hypothetical protein IRB79_26670 [Cytobacillus oceanisediminis]
MAINPRFIKSFEKEVMKNHPKLFERLTSDFNPKQGTLSSGRVAGTGSWQGNNRSAGFMNSLVTQAASDIRKGQIAANANKPKVIRRAKAEAEALRRGATARAYKPVTKSVSEMTAPQRRARIEELRVKRGARNAPRVLDETLVYPRQLGRLGATGSTLLGSGAQYFSREGSIKSALKGTVASSAVSAGAHGGIAALQGEDPWEAAKTGALRGAMAGAGYHGLKGATWADAGSIRGNLKAIGQGVKQTHMTHSVKGQLALRDKGISRQLEQIMRANQEARKAENLLFR